MRPVHWLLMLSAARWCRHRCSASQPVRVSFGHRFMGSGKPLRIGSPASYARTLLTRGKVVAGFEARRASIRAQVEQLASAAWRARDPQRCAAR